MLAAPKPNISYDLQQVNHLKRKTNENLQDSSLHKKPKGIFTVFNLFSFSFFSIFIAFTPRSTLTQSGSTC